MEFFDYLEKKDQEKHKKVKLSDTLLNKRLMPERKLEEQGNYTVLGLLESFAEILSKEDQLERDLAIQKHSRWLKR